MNVFYWGSVTYSAQEPTEEGPGVMCVMVLSVNGLR